MSLPRTNSPLVLAIVVAGIALAIGCFWCFASSDRDPRGADVGCVDSGNLCKGAKVSLVALVREHHRQLGDDIRIECGFVEPGAAGYGLVRPQYVSPNTCRGSRFVVVFSDGKRLKTVWVEAGQVVRLDNYPAHVLDF